MDSSLKRCGSERIRRDEEGTSSGRAELGGYAAILKRTPDTQVADEGKTLAKAGDSYQWTDRTTRLVYSYYDRTAHQWKKGTWSKTIRNAARRGAAESLMEDRLQRGANKWRTEVFKPRLELWEREQIEPAGSTEKWETVALGQWMQKAAWNRMVTRTMREQPRHAGVFFRQFGNISVRVTPPEMGQALVWDMWPV
jgi:hypothetical protein